MWQYFLVCYLRTVQWVGVPSSHDKKRMAAGWNQLSPGATGSAEGWFYWGYPIEVDAGVKNSRKRKKQYLEQCHWFFLSYTRDMFDLQRLVINWKKRPGATDEVLTVHTWEAATQQWQQDHDQVFTGKLFLEELPVFNFVRGLWQQPKEGHTDFCCSPACPVQAIVLLHADAEPFSKKGQFASGSLYLFAVSVILSQDRATFRLIFVSVHLWQGVEEDVWPIDCLWAEEAEDSQ